MMLVTMNYNFGLQMLSMISIIGQNHSLCTAGVPNIALFYLLQGQLLQLRSVQMEEHLHPHMVTILLK